nr:hypothetical protein CFP56_79148 [Quercus suber]
MCYWPGLQASQSGYAVDYVTWICCRLCYSRTIRWVSWELSKPELSSWIFSLWTPHQSGSQGLFTQVGFNDPSQDDASQSHFGVANANLLQSQVSSSFNGVANEDESDDKPPNKCILVWQGNVAKIC